MFSWSEFTAAEPSLAAGIRALLEQYGPGMGYLATVRADGAPRLHPVSPVIPDRPRGPRDRPARDRRRGHRPACLRRGRLAALRVADRASHPAKERPDRRV